VLGQPGELGVLAIGKPGGLRMLDAPCRLVVEGAPGRLVVQGVMGRPEDFVHG